MQTQPPAQARLAATVALLREAPDGFEMLLLRRNRALAFHGGAWVFPGGRIDAGDYTPGAEGDLDRAARRAAVREVREEAGLSLDEQALFPFARWTTPEMLPKRFDTWFFMAACPGAEVRVDGSEISEHRWLRPKQALALRKAGELELPAPTFVTTLRLAESKTAREALARSMEAEVGVFLPRIHRVPGGVVSVYQDDAAYPDGDLDRSGPRHRLWMLESEWRYERGPATPRMGRAIR